MPLTPKQDVDSLRTEIARIKVLSLNQAKLNIELTQSHGICLLEISALKEQADKDKMEQKIEADKAALKLAELLTEVESLKIQVNINLYFNTINFFVNVVNKVLLLLKLDMIL